MKQPGYFGVMSDTFKLSRRGLLGLGLRGAASVAFGSMFSFESAQAAGRRPKAGQKGSSAWIVGQDDFLDDSGIDDPQAQVNAHLDLPFYTASLTKNWTHFAALREIEKGRLSWDEELVMSDYALMRSTNSAFANLVRDNFIVVDGRRREAITVREAIAWGASCSLNDGTVALAERLANGKPISKGISVRESMALERAFARNYVGPVLDEFKMRDTQIRSSTGLLLYPKHGHPATFNDYSSHRDVMKMVNAMVAEFEDHMAMYKVPELKIRRVYKDPDTSRWHDVHARFANDTPLLETSVEANDAGTRAIPTKGVVGLKSGLHRYALWQAIHLFDLSEIGGKGYMASVSTGNTNETYASAPKRVLDNALGLVEPQIRLQHDVKPHARMEPV